MRHQLSIIVLFLSPPLVSCPLYADWSMILEPFLPPSPLLCPYARSSDISLDSALLS
jgi:hypothetical protein